MAMPPSDSPNYIPSVRAHRLAASLRGFRVAAHLSQKHAAASLGWSPAKVGHIETCVRRADPGDVELMLDLYGVVGPDRDVILALAKEAERRSWWTEYVDVLNGPYVALEDAASEILEWEPQVIPGLLQTPEYARQIITSARGEANDLNKRLEAREKRQKILNRPDAPMLHVVLDEAVLERPIGGPDVMGEQLRRLSVQSRRENVTIQVLPKAFGLHTGMEGSLIVLRFAEPSYPDVAYCEGFFGAVYLESPASVASCNLAFEQLRKAALSPEESAALIDAAARR